MLLLLLLLLPRTRSCTHDKHQRHGGGNNKAWPRCRQQCKRADVQQTRATVMQFVYDREQGQGLHEVPEASVEVRLYLQRNNSVKVAGVGVGGVRGGGRRRGGGVGLCLWYMCPYTLSSAA